MGNMLENWIVFYKSALRNCEIRHVGAAADAPPTHPSSEIGISAVNGADV